METALLGLLVVLALDGGWSARAIVVASTVALMMTRIGPLVPIGSGAGMFLILRHFGPF